MQNDQRLVDTLIKYWRKRKGAELMPVYEAFAPESLGDDIWQQCCAFSVQVSNKKQILITDYTGTKACQAMGRDITGEVLAVGAKQFEAARLLQQAEAVLDKKDPLTDEGHFVNAQSKIIKFRSCLLPFGRKEKITHLLLGISWQTF